MIVSIEIPVIRGGWLVQCIDSVLAQTSGNWTLSMLWDGGDALSRDLLDRIDAVGSSRIRVYSGERLGIAHARQFLSERSRGDLILPVDDDDVLEPDAVEAFIGAALGMPWAGIIRARRTFIDERGTEVRMPDWFPFERRHYYRGATLDVANHAQPYAIRRDAFLAAGGWTGFEDFLGMGEDCGCFAAMEEVSDIGLLDRPLYRYRLHGSRTSHRVTNANADEMWRRIADHSIVRRGAPVTRVTQKPPFAYQAAQRPTPTLDNIEVVIPFWESDHREVAHHSSRPGSAALSSTIVLVPHAQYVQYCNPLIPPFNRVSVALSSTGAVDGELVLALFDSPAAFSPAVVVRRRIATAAALHFEFIDIDISATASELSPVARLELAFEPSLGQTNRVLAHTLRTRERDTALMRFFESAPGHCRRGLDRCIASLVGAGIARAAIHVIERRASSAANRNVGIRACSAPWILFMDDDAELGGATTLPRMFDAMHRLDADLAGPKLLNGAGRIYSGIPEVDPLLRETRVGGMGEEDRGQYDRDLLVPWLPSTILLVNRAVIAATNAFDERFEGSQHEDADFALRARDRGFECCYAGSATGIHHNELRNSQFSRNNAYLAERWKSRPDLFAYPLTRAERALRAR